MDLIVVAVAALVLLTVADARLWPDAASQNWRQPQGRWMPKRIIPKRRPRVSRRGHIQCPASSLRVGARRPAHYGGGNSVSPGFMVILPFL